MDIRLDSFHEQLVLLHASESVFQTFHYDKLVNVIVDQQTYLTRHSEINICADMARQKGGGDIKKYYIRLQTVQNSKNIFAILTE